MTYSQHRCLYRVHRGLFWVALAGVVAMCIVGDWLPAFWAAATAAVARANMAINRYYMRQCAPAPRA